MNLINLPFIANVRRNHGFEHATIHVLSQKHKRLSMVGRSDWGGFTLYGTVDTEDVKWAAAEALRRLRNGEAHLAVHPRCGTMLVTTGLMTGIAAFFAIAMDNQTTRRFRWTALPAAISAATMAALFAQPLGLFLQEQYTTCGDPANLNIKRIRVVPNANMVVHRVETIQ